MKLLLKTVYIVISVIGIGKCYSQNQNTWPEKISFQVVSESTDTFTIINGISLYAYLDSIDYLIFLNTSHQPNDNNVILETKKYSAWDIENKEECFAFPGTFPHPNFLFLYIYYLKPENMFYLQYDCLQNHGDLIWGPFKGNPKLVFKE
ncbi:MAG: hypothetical protein JXL97_02870 [Bacteroidales bacterium]|nr:hypothetical protein [Bacteroidales bacterium]